MAATKDIEISLPQRQLERLAALEASGEERDAIISKALDLYLESLEKRAAELEKKA